MNRFTQFFKSLWPAEPLKSTDRLEKEEKAREFPTVACGCTPKASFMSSNSCESRVRAIKENRGSKGDF